MIYEIIMSKGQTIKIDEEDLQKIQENIKAPLVKVKQGIINPSFMVSIIPTNEADTKIKNIIEVKDGRARITGTKEVKVLADTMNINNTKRLHE